MGRNLLVPKNKGREQKEAKRVFFPTLVNRVIEATRSLWIQCTRQIEDPT